MSLYPTIDCGVCRLPVREDAAVTVPVMGSKTDDLDVCRRCYGVLDAYMAVCADRMDVQQAKRQAARSKAEIEAKCGSVVCCTDPNCTGGLR